MHWNKGFAAHFRSSDAKLFYVHHRGRGLSNNAGIFMWFDGAAPEYGLAAHENAHMLTALNWGGSSSVLVEGIGRYAEAMAAEMATIAIGADPYLRAGAAKDEVAMEASWVAVHGMGLLDLEGEWLRFLSAPQ